jgi:hypothetical protein
MIFLFWGSLPKKGSAALPFMRIMMWTLGWSLAEAVFFFD